MQLKWEWNLIRNHYNGFDIHNIIKISDFGVNYKEVEFIRI